MFTQQKRAITICLVAIILNLEFSAIARFFNLPLWLDTTGTIYAAMVLGFPYGFVVGLVNNVFWTIATYGENSFAFYIVSLAVAFVAARVSPKRAKMTFKVYWELAVVLFSVGAVLASLTTLLVGGGIPVDYWGNWLFAYFESRGIDPILASIASVSVVKALDTVVTLLLVGLALNLTPLRYLDDSYVLRRSPQ